MANKRRLTPDDYARMDQAVKPTGSEVYAPVTHQHRGQLMRSIHVFARMPNEHELQTYEATASSVTFKGKKAHVKNQTTLAGKVLYDTLIIRAYDVPYGNTRILGEVAETPPGSGTFTGDPLSREDAIKFVDAMTKKQAMIELVGQVWAASGRDEDEEDEETEEAAPPNPPVAGPTPAALPAPRPAGRSGE